MYLYVYEVSKATVSNHFNAKLLLKRVMNMDIALFSSVLDVVDTLIMTFY